MLLQKRYSFADLNGNDCVVTAVANLFCLLNYSECWSSNKKTYIWEISKVPNRSIGLRCQNMQCLVSYQQTLMSCDHTFVSCMF